jgi:hypothetical protein
MSVRSKCILLSTLVMVASAAFGQTTIVNFDFGAVRIACSNGYAYEGPQGSCPFNDPTQNFNRSQGFGWVLGGIIARTGPPSINVGSGLTGPSGVFYPPPFDGMPFSQAVFLQGPGAFVWQSVEGFAAGNYTLSFYLGSRYISCCGYDGNQTVAALIDGHFIGSWALTSFTPFALQTVSFTVSTGGTHSLMFEGLNPGDHTAFLSYVTIAPTELR